MANSASIVYFDIKSNETEVKLGQSGSAKHFFNDTEVNLRLGSQYYLDFESITPLGVRVPEALIERISGFSFSNDFLHLSAVRRYGLYELGEAKLNINPPSIIDDSRYCMLELVSKNLPDAIALYCNFMAGTIWPTMDYEAVQEISQEALVAKLKADRVVKDKDSGTNLGTDKESLGVRLLKAEKAINCAHLLDDAERHYELKEFDECNKYLIAMGF